MDRLDYMVTIVGTNVTDDYLAFFRRRGVKMALKATCRGTAPEDILNYFGLSDDEKNIILTPMTHRKAMYILNMFDGESQLNRAGAGIAFTVPVSGVAGLRTLKYLIDSTVSEKEETGLKERTDHELIIAVAARGYVDTVMDIARSAGVKGGTVIHSLGTELNPDEREFFDISVGKEREVILMLVKSEIRDTAMKQIADNAGLHTPAQCVLLSLPVNGVAGIS